MTWYDKAKDVARSYKGNQQELSILLESREKGIKSANVVSMRSGRISKPVEAAVVEALSNERIEYLSKALGAVDHARYCASAKAEGEITLKIFEMVYRDKTHKLYGAALVLGISERTARRYNQFFLKIIASRMGFLQLF